LAYSFESSSTVFRFSAEVADALQRHLPVVALESNVIAHGFRHPDNLTIAGEVEDVVRAAGAVPATLAVLDAHIIVGASTPQIERLATAPKVAKVTSRDLAISLLGNGVGATSISATMTIAHQVGIATVASAGLGGVHRGAEISMDISSDLTELARTRLIVVSAGVKKILDAGRTLEFLETQGTPVIGYRQREFPAFYCLDSGFGTQLRVDDPGEVARIWLLHRSVSATGSVLVTHPIPATEALNPDRVEAAIEAALRQARDKGITGPAITTYVQQAVDAATDGATSAANRAVLLSTARAGAEIEVARATLEHGSLDAR
jgi:pseudouridine-5'-phosphate glycosidase